MRRRIAGSTVALLVAASLGSASRAHAQSIPSSFTPRGLSIFEQIVAQYQFSGCTSGVVSESRATGQVFGTPYCVRGQVTVGTRPFNDPGRALYGLIDMAYSLNPLVSHGMQLEDTQWVFGPGGLAGGFTVSPSSPSQDDGSQVTFRSELITTDVNRAIDLRTIQPSLTYSIPSDQFGPGSRSRAFTTTQFALTAVPEPSTYALMATGLLGVLGLSRRQRKA